MIVGVQCTFQVEPDFCMPILSAFIASKFDCT
jgi:hypothetical protein